MILWFVVWIFDVVDPKFQPDISSQASYVGEFNVTILPNLGHEVSEGQLSQVVGTNQRSQWQLGD
jgi:hypothetical protein